MLVAVVYTDENGETHFTDKDFKLNDKGDIGSLSDPIPATKMILRTTPAGYDYDWHNTPRTQFVIILEGSVVIQTSDGDIRRFDDGGVFLLLDVDGKGHYSFDPINKVRKSVFIGVDYTL